MIKVLIVDDELIVRVGIKSIIDWNANGFTIVGEASDGEDALKKIPELTPDIILTDIKMPKLDGIELIKAVHEKYRDIKVVVLSCHNDFDLVKKALKLGAIDYILKLSMQPDDLLEVMNQVKTQLREVQTPVSLDYPSYHNNMDTYADKEKLLEEILSNSLISPNEIYKIANQYNYKLKEGSYIILVTKINKYLSKTNREKLEDRVLRDSILNLMNNTASKYLSCEVFGKSNEEYVTIVNIENEATDFGSTAPKIFQFISHLHDQLQTYINIHAVTGVYDTIIKNIKDIGNAYKLALAASERGFYSDKSEIILYSNLKQYFSIKQYFSVSMLKDISNQLKSGKIDTIQSTVYGVFASLKANRDVPPGEIKKVIKQLSDIFNIIFIETDLSNEYYEEIMANDFSDKINAADSILELQDTLNSFMNLYMKLYYEQKKGIYHEGICKLKDYINENYYKKISLNTAASFLNISKNYFCYIFKIETGETFYEYITGVRIQNAKKLLKTTNLGINAVAEKVGYDNINYFYTLFKKNVGISPKKYIESRE